MKAKEPGGGKNGVGVLIQRSLAYNIRRKYKLNYWGQFQILKDKAVNHSIKK